MTSDLTDHTAARQPSASWAVSWLPEREVDRNAAITAMMLAEYVAAHDLDDDERSRFVVDCYARELGLEFLQAVQLVTGIEATRDLPGFVGMALDQGRDDDREADLEAERAEPSAGWAHELLAATTTAPYRDALTAIDEALTLPYPATVRDAEVRDGIMLLRVMHVKTFLNGFTRDPAAALAWQIGYFREQIAKHPAAGYVTTTQAQQALDDGANWSEAVDPARHGIPSETEAADQVPAITFTAPDLMASALDQIEAIGTGLLARDISECGGYCAGVCTCTVPYVSAAAASRLGEAYDGAGTL